MVSIYIKIYLQHFCKLYATVFICFTFIADEKFGNLFIKVNIKNIDKRYEFKGNDVYSTQYIPLSKALIGGKESFQTLYGRVERDLPK